MPGLAAPYVLFHGGDRIGPPQGLVEGGRLAWLWLRNGK
jgi:hypothetical protein